MVFSIFVIVCVLVITFFQYTQGFFSATISAIIAVFAAVLAVSYNETVVHLLLKGKFADEAHAMMLVAIFGITYTFLRTIFDKAIPGNVRTPATVDKVGAALMGLITGTFAAGILAIAIQMLPFGPTLGFMGFGRYETKSEDKVTVPAADNGQFDESPVQDRLTETTLKDPTKMASMYYPADDIVMWTAYKLSDGAMPGARTMESIHPDYMFELFTDRLGIQTGGMRSAIQFKGTETVKIDSVYSMPELTGFDDERPEIRSGSLPAGKLIPDSSEETAAAKAAADKKQKSDKKPARYLVKPNGDQALLIVRVHLDDNAVADDNKMFRFSCATVRMVVNVNGKYEDFYPIGTMQPDSKLNPAYVVMLNAPDDFLFVNLKERHGFDIVFLVDKSALQGAKGAQKIADGTFVTINRFANLDLSGMSVEPGDSYRTTTSYIVMRKKSLSQFLKLPDVKPAGDEEPDTKSK
jgi:hypothetical protein